MKKIIAALLLTTILLVSLNVINQPKEEASVSGELFTPYVIQGDPGTGGVGGGGS